MHPEHECEKMNLRPSKGKSKLTAHKTHTQHTPKTDTAINYKRIGE